METEIITSWQLYWLTRLDGIAVLAGLLTFFSSASLILLPIFWSVSTNTSISGTREWEREAACKQAAWIKNAALRTALPVFFVSTGALILVPSSKEMAAIMVIPKIANNEDVQGLGESLVDLAESWMNELKPPAPTETDSE